MSKRFRRQDSFRYKKLGKKWRRPRGRQSKMRKMKGGAGDMPRIGYGTATRDRNKIRGLSADYITSPKDIEKAKEAVLLSGALGKRKRAAAALAAKQKGLVIINSSKARRAVRYMKKKDEEGTLAKKMAELKKKEEEQKNKEEKAAGDAKK